MRTGDNASVTLLAFLIDIISHASKPQMLLLEGCCVYIDSCNSVSLFQGIRRCRVTVWDRPWLHLREVTNVMCTSTKQMDGAAAGMGGAAAGMGGAAAGMGGAAAGMGHAYATPYAHTATMYSAFVPENTSNSVCIAFIVVIYLWAQDLAQK